MGKHEFNDGRVCKHCAVHADNLPRDINNNNRFFPCPEAPIDYHPAYSSEPNYKVLNSPGVKIQPKDSLEGQVLQPLHTARTPTNLLPHMIFTGGLPAKSIEQLLRIGRIQADSKVVHKMNCRFAARVFLALTSNDVQLAVSTYNEALRLPNTEIRRILATDYNIVADGSFLGENTDVLICFKNRKPCALKTVSVQEYDAVVALRDAGVQHSNIVDIEPIKLDEDHVYLVMPFMPVTVCQLRGIDDSNAVILFDQIGSALRCLHDKGFAHMDVKPSNICIDSNGNYILIDFGSCVEFGAVTSTTPPFFPADLYLGDPASAAMDWWMLALTVYDRMLKPSASGAGFAGGWGQSLVSTTQLMDFFASRSSLSSVANVLSELMGKGK